MNIQNVLSKYVGLVYKGKSDLQKLLKSKIYSSMA